MTKISDEELLNRTAAVINSREIGGSTVGDVGAALVTDKGNVYTGICFDMPSGMGICAEHAAVAEMLKAGESKISKIVATWKDPEGNLYTGAPCGKCRELLRQLHPENMDTEVIVDKDKTMSLRELLPLPYEWKKL